MLPQKLDSMQCSPTHKLVQKQVSLTRIHGLHRLLEAEKTVHLVDSAQIVYKSLMSVNRYCLGVLDFFRSRGSCVLRPKRGLVASLYIFSALF